MLFIGEIFRNTNSLKTEQEVINYIKKQSNPMLSQVFEAAYHPAVVWMIPAGEAPPYTPDPSPYGNNITNLNAVMQTMCRYMQGRHLFGNQIQRESSFISLLETLNAEEARIVLLMLNRDLTPEYKWLSYEIANKIWPNILPARVIPIKEEKKENFFEPSIPTVKITPPKKKAIVRPKKIKNG